jgi:hypothetical protein
MRASVDDAAVAAAKLNARMQQKIRRKIVRGHERPVFHDPAKQPQPRTTGRTSESPRDVCRLTKSALAHKADYSTVHRNRTIHASRSGWRFTGDKDIRVMEPLDGFSRNKDTAAFGSTTAAPGAFSKGTYSFRNSMLPGGMISQIAASNREADSVEAAKFRIEQKLSVRNGGNGHHRQQSEEYRHQPADSGRIHTDPMVMDKVARTMARLQLRPMDLFKALDNDHSSTISREELVQGLRR